MATVLITGASRGIGAAFAQALAQQGNDLVLVARTMADLKIVGDPLSQQYGVKVHYLAQDLSLAGAASQIFAQTQAWGVNIDFLINNAGFGDYGEFASRDLAKFTTMIQVNITALVELSHLYLGGMQQRQAGQILNISSMAGFLPMPYLSVYAASKAFVLHFSEALWAENWQRGITVMAVCPGPTQTNFFEVADMTQAPGMDKGDSPESVVQEALTALAQRHSHVVTGAKNRVVVSLPRLLPREVLVKQLASQFQPSA